MADPQVVLVEDDTNVAKLVQLGLRKENLTIRHAASIAEARQFLQGGEWDILLLDRRLPDGDGVELCSEVRPQNPHGYILMLTGDDTSEAKLAGFGCGADDYVTKPFHMEELVARVRAGLRIVGLQKQLLNMSKTDPLTDIRNRRSFDEALDKRFAHARRYNRPLAIAMIDVDHFKQINDKHGHQEGDSVLQNVAGILKRCSRQTDFVARYGGEEFVVILPETPLFEALQFGEKIRASIASHAFDIGRVTVSIGLAAMPHSRFSDPAALLRAADEALYRAKANGRNRVEFERRVTPARSIRAA